MRTGTPLAGAHSDEAQYASLHDHAVEDGPDRIELRGLAAHGYHGVHERERRDGQRFVVDIVVHTDTRPAAAGDDLARTLDYAALARQVVGVLTGPSVALLETLAERIAATALAHPQAVAVDVTVHKPQAQLFDQIEDVSPAVEFADVVVSVRRDRTRVPVVDPAAQVDPTVQSDRALRAGWASAAPAPALDAHPPGSLVDGSAVPDPAPHATDLADAPSAAAYEPAGPAGDRPVDIGAVVAEPAIVPPDGSEGATPPTGEADEPPAAGAEAPDQSMWGEPMPPSIPPAMAAPAPSSAGAVVVTPGFGPVVAPLASNPDAAAPAQAGGEPARAPEPVVPDEPPARPDTVLPGGSAYTSAPDASPEPVVAPNIAPLAVEASWPAETPPDQAVPDPVWVPAPEPQETPLQAQSGPATPDWQGVPEPAPWAGQAQPADTPAPFGGAPAVAEPYAPADPYQAPVASEPIVAWLQESVPSALPDAPAAGPGSGEPAEMAQPWAGAPAASSDQPAPPVEPWGSAPGLAGEWSPPPPPQWANLDPPGGALGGAPEQAAPSVPSFGMPGPAFDTPAQPAGAEALDRSPDTLTEVVIGLGGNLGPVQETLRWAVLRLGAMTGLEVTAVGPLARTAAVGNTEQPDYLNTVVLARTLLSPRDLLHRLQGVEREAGRERLERWGPRTLDLDIITYGDLVAGDDSLTLPHPQAHARAFVLGPWVSLQPDAVLPGPDGGSVARLADQAPDAEGVRWMALDWLTDTSGEPGVA